MYVDETHLIPEEVRPLRQGCEMRHSRGEPYFWLPTYLFIRGLDQSSNISLERLDGLALHVHAHRCVQERVEGWDYFRIYLTKLVNNCKATESVVLTKSIQSRQFAFSRGSVGCNKTVLSNSSS